MAIAQTTDVERAIVATALDYYEGWFEGEPERMERALHPDLVKRSLAADESRPRDTQIHIDHVYEDIATATGTSAIYVDYLQLAPTRDGWKIVNVLWDRVVQAG